MNNTNQTQQSQYVGAINRNDRVGALYRAWGHIFSSQIEGDYIEFGVYRGTTFVESHNIYSYFHEEHLRNVNSSEVWRRSLSEKLVKYSPSFHGLDTFSGIPENNEGNLAYSKGAYSASFDEVERRCKDAELNNFFLYEGLFKETGGELRKKCNKAAIINIDGDLYESAVDALEISKPLIQIGTVMMFDDYNAFAANNNCGERKAFREFQKTFPGKFEPWFSYMILGQSFICVDL